MFPQQFIPCKYPQLLHYYVCYRIRPSSFESCDKEVYDAFRSFMLELGFEVDEVADNAPFLCFTDNVVYHYDKPNKYKVKRLAGVGYRSADKEIKTMEDLFAFVSLVDSKVS